MFRCTRFYCTLLLGLVLGSILSSTVSAQVLYVVSYSTDSNDQATSAIKRYNGTTGAYLDTVATSTGNSVPIYGGVVFNKADGDVYITSSAIGDSNILRYNGLSGAPDPSAGNTGAVFLHNGLGVGNGLTGPGQLTFGPDSNIYVASLGRILRYNGTTGAGMPSPGNTVSTFVARDTTRLSSPQGMAFGPDNNLYVTSSLNLQNGTVEKYDGSTGAYLGTFVPTGRGGINDPFGLQFGPDHNLYVGNNVMDANNNITASEILRYNGTTGAYIDTFITSPSGGLYGAAGFVFGPDGNLYVASAGTDSILRYDGTTGAFLNSFVVSGSGGLQLPLNIAFAPAATPAPGALLTALIGLLPGISLVRSRRKRAQ